MDQTVISHFAYLYGDDHNDTLTFVGIGLQSAGFIYAGSGNETLIASGYYAQLHAGSGHDELIGLARTNIMYDGTGSANFVVTGNFPSQTTVIGWHSGDHLIVPEGAHVQVHSKQGFADIVDHGASIGTVFAPHIHFASGDIIHA